MIFIKSAYAAGLTSKDFGVTRMLGNVSNFQTMFTFVFNFLVWIGWIGIVFGLSYGIFSLIRKMAFSNETEDVEQFKLGMTRAFLISFLGAIMLSAGFFVTLVGGWLGMTVDFDFWITF